MHTYNSVSYESEDYRAPVRLWPDLGLVRRLEADGMKHQVDVISL